MLLLLPVIESLPIKLKVSRQNHFRVNSKTYTPIRERRGYLRSKENLGESLMITMKEKGIVETVLKGLLIP